MMMTTMDNGFLCLFSQTCGLWIIFILSKLLKDGTYTGVVALQGKPWPIAEWKFYIAFCLFRGASIFAGIYSRWIMV